MEGVLKNTHCIQKLRILSFINNFTGSQSTTVAMNSDHPNIIQPGENENISPEGVDLTLIRWMLSMTPIERLRILESQIRNIHRLRGELDD